MQNISEDLRAFISENFLFGQGIEELGDDESFLEKGIVDSTGVLQLITFLEETYEIQLPDDELIADNLDSIKRVRNFVERKLASKDLDGAEENTLAVAAGSNGRGTW